MRTTFYVQLRLKRRTNSVYILIKELLLAGASIKGGVYRLLLWINLQINQWNWKEALDRLLASIHTAS